MNPKALPAYERRRAAVESIENAMPGLGARDRAYVKRQNLADMPIAELERFAADVRGRSR